MGIANIDGSLFRKMIIAGACALDKNKEEIDALNVFPVPDGDTGTNMSLTFLAAAREAEKLEEAGVSAVAKAVANGSLRGARGNSGVILSQLFRGFAKGLEGCETADADDIANAFIKASETAYKAVMKPKEGTILTIARAMAEKASELSFDTDDVEVLIYETIKHGNDILARTVEMLPALKQAGVVDAGGYGLICIWQAALASINSDSAGDISLGAASGTVGQLAPYKYSAAASGSADDIEFAYCTEFFIITENATEETESEMKEFLSGIGDSIVAVADEDIIKIHVHTNNPGAALEKALQIGYLDSVKIENMRLQHTNLINFKPGDKNIEPGNAEEAAEESIEAAEYKDVGFIVVSAGEGFRELFESLGADIVIEGGQTMNPSTNDFIASIEKLNANNIVIMPNNKNVILAAQQASNLVEGKNIFVLPTKTVPQGVSALINYLDSEPVETSFSKMEEAIKHVRTGQITYAVRSTVIDDKQIEQGDILCMLGSSIELVEKSVQNGSKRLLDIMLEGGGEVLSIFYGDSTTEEEAMELMDYVLEKHPDIEAEIHNGGQPIYNYIFSIE